MLVILGPLGDIHLPPEGSFNLVIEMLVISGEKRAQLLRRCASKFQSRNRDACHFRRAVLT